MTKITKDEFNNIVHLAFLAYKAPKSKSQQDSSSISSSNSASHLVTPSKKNKNIPQIRWSKLTYNKFVETYKLACSQYEINENLNRDFGEAANNSYQIAQENAKKAADDLIKIGEEITEESFNESLILHLIKIFNGDFKTKYTLKQYNEHTSDLTNFSATTDHYQEAKVRKIAFSSVDSSSTPFLDNSQTLKPLTPSSSTITSNPQKTISTSFFLQIMSSKYTKIVGALLLLAGLAALTAGGLGLAGLIALFSIPSLTVLGAGGTGVIAGSTLLIGSIFASRKINQDKFNIEESNQRSPIL